MNDEKLQRLKDIIQLTNGTLTKQEFLSAFEQVVEHVKASRKANDTEWTLIHSAFQMLESKLTDTVSGLADEARGTHRNDVEELNRTVQARLDAAFSAFKSDTDRIFQEHQEAIGGVSDKVDAVLLALDLKPADDQAIAQKVMGQIRQLFDDEIEKLREDMKPTASGAAKSGWGAHPLTVAEAGATRSKTTRHINFTGTGVTSVTRNPDGTVDVNIGGGGGGGGTSIVSVSGTIDDSNTSFTASSSVSAVVVNGASYRNGHGCTITGGTAIVLDSPIGTGGDIYALASAASVISVTGTIDNSNTSFTATSAPMIVVVNGASYRNGHGVTITGTAITLDSPVGVGGDIYSL